MKRLGEADDSVGRDELHEGELRLQGERGGEWEQRADLVSAEHSEGDMAAWDAQRRRPLSTARA